MLREACPWSRGGDEAVTSISNLKSEEVLCKALCSNRLLQMNAPCFSWEDKPAILEVARKPKIHGERNGATFPSSVLRTPTFWRQLHFRLQSVTLVVTKGQVAARDNVNYDKLSLILHEVLLYIQIFLKGTNPPILFPHTFPNFLSLLTFITVSYKIRINYSFVKAQDALIRQLISPLQINTLVTVGEETASVLFLCSQHYLLILRTWPVSWKDKSAW